MRVTVLGAGYVGATSAAVLAYLGHDVTCVEREAARLACWRAGADALGEPGLAELLRSVQIRFVDEPSALASSDVVIVAVGTPVGDEGYPDLTQLDAAALEIAELATSGTVVIMRSTVPVGTCDRLQDGPLRHLEVVSNPEFLREGRAIHDAFYPERFVVGGRAEARATVEALYRGILEGRDLPGADGYARRVPMLWMSTRSAELAKYAANGFLATKLSFVNEIANLAQVVGADASAVLGSMALDTRIGAHYLRPGLGWGGSCFPKDTRALEAIANGEGYDFVVLRAAIDQNAMQLQRFSEAIEAALPDRARVAVLGLAFKAGTQDTRESPALTLARRLVKSGLALTAYDPAVRDLPDDPSVLVRSSVAEACAGADAVVVATEWPEFAEIDLGSVRQLMRGDLLFDGRSVISPAAAEAAGFRYHGSSGLEQNLRPMPRGRAASARRRIRALREPDLGLRHGAA